METPNTTPRFLISVPAVGPLAGAAGRTITIPDAMAVVSDDKKYVNVTGKRGFRSHAEIDGIGLNLGFSAPSDNAKPTKAAGANADRATIAALVTMGVWSDKHTAAYGAYVVQGKSVQQMLDDIKSGALKIA